MSGNPQAAMFDLGDGEWLFFGADRVLYRAFFHDGPCCSYWTVDRVYGIESDGEVMSTYDPGGVEEP